MFGLICGAIAWIAKYFLNSIKEERKRHDEDIIKTMKNGLSEHNQQMQKDMTACSTKLLDIVEKKNEELLKADQQIHEEIDNLRDGILSIQGRDFKEVCHELLQENHIITAVEYEQILADHIAYNKLGGNHEGDALFSMIEAKYKNTIGGLK